MIKKSALILIILAIAFLSIFLIIKLEPFLADPVTSTQIPGNPIKITLNYGQANKSDYLVSAHQQSLYWHLQQIAQSQNLTMQSRQTENGIVIESINNVTNNKKNQWQYFLNGEQIKVAPDLIILQPGDLIEWRYAQLEAEE